LQVSTGEMSLIAGRFCPEKEDRRQSCHHRWGSIGCETGIFWLERGKRVVLVFPEAAPMTLEPVDWRSMKMLLQRLKEKGVRIVAGVKD